VTELKERGFTNDEIASVTGHKSSDSVAAYHRRRRDIEKRKLSDALNEGLSSNPTRSIEENALPKNSKIDFQPPTTTAETIEIKRGASNYSVQLNEQFSGCTFIFN